MMTDEERKKKVMGYGGLPITWPSETMRQNAARIGLQLSDEKPKVVAKKKKPSEKFEEWLDEPSKKDRGWN